MTTIDVLDNLARDLLGVHCISDAIASPILDQMFDQIYVDLRAHVRQEWRINSADSEQLSLVWTGIADALQWDSYKDLHEHAQRKRV